ncbi:CRISPR-associated endonuclease Cas1 [Flavivirga jejuensis]|uniref:CRISPR-associated endonuclease Cas1 n=1 Tax=Flavivirga jejuensis TaxID=870487 RepID=A0ABT8WUT6_9FLAO|nr:CRISPR-associated endonuclease Cas1 [Flavivirga jejuensis]MDO5976948.1 CRISPR-associated endonuclease Cas1 [Flavivirga jejuensis]
MRIAQRFLYSKAIHTTPFKESLVFDMIEIFRPIMDRLLIGLCQENQLKPIHFKRVTGGFWLSKAGKKVVITAFNKYLVQRIKIENRVATIQNHMYLQAQHLKLLINTDYDVPYNL